MNDLPHTERANALARWSLAQAAWPPALIVAVCIVQIAIAPAAHDGLLATGSRLVAAAGALAVFGFSAILLFDALLFRLMASYEDEQKGGAAVDDILARMRLKSTPPKTRSLAGRAAGTRRLVNRQRLALALFAAASVLLFLAAPV